MGLAIAEKLSDLGYQMAIMSRGDDIHDLGKKLNAIAVQGSTANKSDLENLVRKTHGEYGRIDVVVNNTGHSAKGQLMELTDDQWTEGFELLVMNVIRMSQLVAPIMERQASGSIVNISTFGAKEPSLNFPISSVLRSSLGSYAKLFAEEFAAKGLRMNNVLPGFVDSYKADESTIQSIAAKRQATTKEVAEVVAFLAGGSSSYINGQSIVVDGGLTKSF